MTRTPDTDESPLEVVNVVGSGSLGSEVDIEQVSQDADIHEADYEDGTGSVYLRFEGDLGLIILYRTGNYIIRGGKEYEKLYRTNNRFLEFVENLGITENTDDIEIEINNIVFVGDFERAIDLNELVIRLGLENAEFEPEQFPGLVYRPANSDCVLLVFGSGKVSITGSSSEREALEAFSSLQDIVEKM